MSVRPGTVGISFHAATGSTLYCEVARGPEPAWPIAGCWFVWDKILGPIGPARRHFLAMLHLSSWNKSESTARAVLCELRPAEHGLPKFGAFSRQNLLVVDH